MAKPVSVARPVNLAGLERDGLAAALAPLGARPYAARQLFRWIYARRERDFARMTDLARTLREALARDFEVRFPEVQAALPSGDGTTRYVYRLDDGERVESVWIPGSSPGSASGSGGAGGAAGEPADNDDEDDDRQAKTGTQATLCLSSQVGCALACSFCVSGLIGVKRNLTAGEIVGQALAMIGREGAVDRVNVVFMGMGEALLNLDAVAAAFRLLSDPDGPNISLRRMTVSTAGHVPALERFGQLAARPRLAVSLNATSDEQRERIMPINRAWPLAELLAACRRFPLGKKERITFEYVLLAGINNSPEDARRLPHLLAGIPAKVNLIPWNPAPGFDFATPADDVVERFARILHQHRLTVTVRKRRGADVGAACGQLAVRRPDEAGAAPSPSSAADSLR